MRAFQSQSPTRPGGIAPLAVIFMVVLFAGVACAVDLTWVVLTQAELHNVADAAALAGSNKLIDNHVLYHLPAQTSAQKAALLQQAQDQARAAAKLYASFNGAGDRSTLKLRDEDIEFGYLDEANVYTPRPKYTGYPNTVKVRLRRDRKANDPLDLYFARIIAQGSIELAVDAAASVFTGSIDSFASYPGASVPALPVTYDVDHWNQFLKTGKDPDGKTQIAANGNPQLQVYPSIKYKGNFGLLSLDDEHVGASTVRTWIDRGMSSNDVQALKDHQLVPLSAHPKNTWDWNGENGFKASNIMDINNYIGKTFIIPLYQAKDPSAKSYQAGVGEGSNFNFNIVQFVGITIMAPKDKNGDVVVQPAAIVEPDVAFLSGSIKPAQPPSETSNLVTTFTTPKLTR